MRKRMNKKEMEKMETNGKDSKSVRKNMIGDIET